MGTNFYIWLAFTFAILLPGKARIIPELELLHFSDGNGTLIDAVLQTGLEDLTKFPFQGSENQEKHVHFYLYTKENKKNPIELFVGGVKQLENSKFDKEAPTKIIIHGFTHSDSVGLPPAARSAYLESENAPLVNLIVVDWGKLALAPWYNDAARNTRLVGVKVARFIEFLVHQGASLNQIHIIGHSLGSHIAGFAGSNLNNMTLSRITALDPALPLFEDVSDENRIDPSDAAFVDVIHTAGGSSSASRGRAALAFIEPRGHVDFYVNGGQVQPGCGADFFGTCSHLRAYEYYFETVSNTEGFPSCECKSWEEYKLGKCICSEVEFLGEKCSFSARGLFYLRTRPNKPYAINEHQVN